MIAQRSHFPLHAQRGAAYLTAPNIPARHAFHPPRRREHRRAREPESQRPAATRRKMLAKNWRRLGAAAELDLTRAVYTKQVHSADVRIAHAADCRNRRRWSRALPATALSRLSRMSLAVFIADCLPALLHDPVAGVIGAVHCGGWRGSVADPRRCRRADVRPRRATTEHPRCHRSSARAASRSDLRSLPWRKPCCMENRSARSCARARTARPCSISRASTRRSLRSSASRRGRSPCRTPAPCAGRMCSGRTARADGRRGVQGRHLPCDPRGNPLKHLHLTRLLAFALALTAARAALHCGDDARTIPLETVGKKDTQTAVELDGKFTLNYSASAGMDPVQNTKYR